MIPSTPDLRETGGNPHLPSKTRRRIAAALAWLEWWTVGPLPRGWGG